MLSTAKQGVFSKPLDLQDGDRLYWLGDRRLEVVRGGKVLCQFYCDDWELPEPKLQPKRLRKDAGEDKERSSADIPPGAKWITVNPSGAEGAGHPILVMPHEDGGATVIGGAGGKLNLMKLDKLRSPEEWKASARERAQKRREEEIKRKESQSEDERKAEAEKTEKIKEYKQTTAHENALKTLQELNKHNIEHGLSDEHKHALLYPPNIGSTPDEVDEWKRLTREATDRVKAIQRAYEVKLVTDHEARAAAKLGDEDLDTANRVIEGSSHTAVSAAGEAIATLQQLPTGEWLAKGSGDEPPQVYKSWGDAAKAHVRNVLAAEQETGEDRTQPDNFYDPSQWVKQPKQEQLPEGFEFKPQAALAIAQLAAERKAAEKQARTAEEAVKKRSPLELGQGIDLGPVREITQREVLDKLEAEAKTLEDAHINNRFLELIKDAGEADKMRTHTMVGGYSKLAEIASDVLKQNSISRGLVDALGHNEAAKLLAYQMRQVLTPAEYDAATRAQAAYHAETSTRIARATTEQVKPMLEELARLHEEMLFIQGMADGDTTPDQQIQLDSLAYDARSLHDSIQQTLGTTLGQLQASAAMVAAMEGRGKTLRVTGDSAKKLMEKLPGVFGGEPSEGQPSALAAYGVTTDDFHVLEGPDGTVVQINQSGVDKLSVGYNPEDREAYERAQAIKRGEFDEEGFVPTGFSHYAKATFTDAATEAQQFDTSFEVLGKLAQLEGASQATLSLFGDPEPSADPVEDSEIESGLRSYVGARVANGENPLDVMNDVRSPEFYMQQGLDPYGASALKVQEISANLIKQLAGGDGSRISDKAVVSAFQQLGDEEAAKQRRSRSTDDLQALHSQSIEHEPAVEAAHRTLASMPMARIALKPWGELTGKERKSLREYAITEVLGQALDPPREKKKSEIPSEVAEEQYDLFGNKISAAEALGGEDEGEELTQWQEFSKLMGGDAKAYAAVRDHLKGKFMHRFANAYGAIAPSPLMIGGENIQHVDRLLLAKLPEDKRNEMLEFMRARDASDVAKVRSRAGGKFASEMDSEWLAKFEELKGDNRQISLLAADTGRTTSKTDYQRTTLGRQAEEQLNQALNQVLPNFSQVNSAVDIIPEVNWGAGTPHATKQRALKFLESQKKVGIHFGAGSGKSAIMLGAFTHLHAQGKAKKMIVAVPSSIVGQFVGEAVSFLKPGTYNYNANLGMSREDRIKAYSDPNLHIHVTTRESLANDLLHLVEKHQGVTAEAYRELPEAQQKELMLQAAKTEGIDTDGLLLSVDEAHDITARKGVDPSKRSLALNHLGHHAGHYIQATGDAIKNDMSEMFNFLHSVAPEKFNDMGKFMSEYGGNTPSSRKALQRAIAPYSFAASTKPRDKAGKHLKMNEFQPKIAVSEHIATERQRVLDDVQILSDWQTKRREQLKAEYGEGYQPTTEDFNTAWEDEKVRGAIARLGSEDTWGAMGEDQQKQAIGGQIRALGGLKRTALWRLYHRTDYANNPKAQWTVDHAVKKFKEEGKAGVIFSASSQAAEMLVEQLKKKGMRVAYIHGGLSGADKDKERLKFQSENPEADILICTDAARTGVNLTRGKFLIHYDVPLTEMGYSQRSARIHRLKQNVDTEIYTPMLDAPEEKIALARMQRKGKTANPLKSKAEAIDESGLARKIREMRELKTA